MNKDEFFEKKVLTKGERFGIMAKPSRERGKRKGHLRVTKAKDLEN
ncbi:MAG: hypothetical protein SO393_01190 [Eubacterium sp.]|nr:hypothetical protein [Oscillospiraceae bacterium]MDD6355924.1 hypothetical protein [Oscillospiraceae bacterium]MDY4607514.1 hypothetical protein [Eubacterium sp.]